jgi:hypothetical protein
LICDLYALITASMSFENGKGVIFAAIIYVNCFPFLENLCEQAIKGIGNISCVVVTRDDYRYCEWIITSKINYQLVFSVYNFVGPAFCSTQM